MRLPGIKDEEFIRDKVPMTKEEVRIITLCKAKIAEDSVVWDVGAGTGSLSIESALIAPKGHVYAIEKKPLGIDMIKTNAEKFGVTENLTVIHGEAPDALADLPECEVALIGGSGKNTAAILDLIDSKLKVGGRIVANAVTLQTIGILTDYMTKATNYDYETIQVQVNRVRKVGPYDMYDAQNPIFIVTCEKKGERK